MKTNLYIILALFSLLFSACSDDDNDSSPATEGGSFILEFDNRVGSTNLNLNTEDYPYTNSNGQSFNVTMLKYYISNVILSKEDGTTYELPMSEDGSVGYYLVDEAVKTSQEVLLENVPEGNYTGITFTIGVDADRVKEGAQTGALDATNQMFWSWNSGYIFLKFEGVSPVSTEDDHILNYHVGGYKSDPEDANLADNIKAVSFTRDFTLSKSGRPQLHFIFDVTKLFESPNTIDFSSNASRHSPAASTEIAENYVNAFVLDHIHE